MPGEDEIRPGVERSFQRIENARVRVTLYEDGELLVTPVPRDPDEGVDTPQMSITEKAGG